MDLFYWTQITKLRIIYWTEQQNLLDAKSAPIFVGKSKYRRQCPDRKIVDSPYYD